MTEAAAPGPDGGVATGCSGSVLSTGAPVTNLPTAPGFTVAAGFRLEVIAQVIAPRELAALPNGDLLVGTSTAGGAAGTDVWVIPNAEASALPYAPVRFTTVNDAPVQGVAFDRDSCAIAIASQHGVFRVAYHDGLLAASAGTPIATVRNGQVAHAVDASVDTDTHVTTSVSVAAAQLYAGVGSSCNACVEVDPTRATVQVMHPDGTRMTTRATRIRNAIALATNPATQTVWVGGAGQDNDALGHPYEYFDALTLHPGVADYGWPACEENRQAFVAGADCSQTVVPLVEFPAYSTLIGAAFYAPPAGATYAFPSTYRGGAFVTLHGSWHKNPDGTYFSAPRVAFVAMNGDAPASPVDWTDPTKQWSELVGGFQGRDGTTRIGRPSGVAVGPKGSLFVADDQTNLVYRIRPT